MTSCILSELGDHERVYTDAIVYQSNATEVEIFSSILYLLWYFFYQDQTKTLFSNVYKLHVRSSPCVRYFQYVVILMLVLQMNSIPDCHLFFCFVLENNWKRDNLFWHFYTENDELRTSSKLVQSIKIKMFDRWIKRGVCFFRNILPDLILYPQIMWRNSLFSYIM